MTDQHGAFFLYPRVPLVGRAKMNDRMIEAAIREVIDEMIGSGHYRALIWAGGYAGHVTHQHSDVDLYAVSVKPFEHHWLMERVNGRRVELTVYPLARWQEILCKPYQQPKHHYTFAHGRVLYDPEELCASLTATAATTLVNWHSSAEQLEALRVGLAIQHDKTLGFMERKMPLHLRYHAIGVVHLACELLVTRWDGYAVDGGKNLTRVLAHPDCPADIKTLLQKLLASPQTSEMADAALDLCRRCLALTGGAVESYHGGIPR